MQTCLEGLGAPHSLSLFLGHEPKTTEVLVCRHPGSPYPSAQNQAFLFSRLTQARSHPVKPGCFVGCCKLEGGRDEILLSSAEEVIAGAIWCKSSLGFPSEPTGLKEASPLEGFPAPFIRSRVGDGWGSPWFKCHFPGGLRMDEQDSPSHLTCGRHHRLVDQRYPAALL